MFLSYNFFFILDTSRQPDLIRFEAEDMTYQLLEVIKTDRENYSTQLENDESLVSIETSEEEDPTVDISQRLISQFLKSLDLEDNFKPTWSLPSSLATSQIS